MINSTPRLLWSCCTDVFDRRENGRRISDRIHPFLRLFSKCKILYYLWNAFTLVYGIWLYCTWIKWLRAQWAIIKCDISIMVHSFWSRENIVICHIPEHRTHPKDNGDVSTLRIAQETSESCPSKISTHNASLGYFMQCVRSSYKSSLSLNASKKQSP